MKRATSTILALSIILAMGMGLPRVARAADPYAPFKVGPLVQVLPGDSPSCQAVKELQIKQYNQLHALKNKPCPAGKEASCIALIDTLNDLCEQTNQKIVSTCVSPWMLHAAGLDH